MSDEEGRVFLWGWNESRQCGKSYSADILVPSEIKGPFSRVSAVAASLSHTILLTYTGNIVVFGKGDYLLIILILSQIRQIWAFRNWRKQ